MFAVRRVFLLLAYVVSGCSAGQQTVEKETFQTVQGQAIGTRWTVKWMGLRHDRGVVRALVDGELARLDEKMSTWRVDSELSQLRGKSGPQELSGETAEVVVAGLALAADTQGAFDPTVGPLMVLWGFKGTRLETLPTDADIAKVMRHVGHERVQVDRVEGTWRIDTVGAELDLSAIAKGTGVDWISRALLKIGVAHHMVEVGGEMRLSGDGPQQALWRVGVDDPNVDVTERRTGLVLQLTDRGVATSGNYRNRYDVNGKSLVHILDPRTGRPSVTDVLSTTVIAGDCQTADGVATALMVMGLEEGKHWVEQRAGIEAAWLMSDGDKTALRYSSGFAPFLRYQSPSYATD